MNISAAQSVDNMEAIVAAVVDSGKRIILVADLPRGKVGGENWRLDQAGEIEHLFTVRKWVLAQRARKNVYVADPYLSWSDQASTFGDALGNVTWDGIHPSCYGAYLLAEALQPVIEFLCPLASRLPVSNLDLFSSANPGGSLTLNPLMLGMAGSKTNANGDVANGFTLTGSTQVTVAASKVFDGLKAWQEIVITGTPTSNQDITLSQTLMAGAVEGDILDLVGEIAVNAGSTGYRGVGLQLIATVEGVNQIASTGEAWADTFCDMPDAYGGVVVTPTLTLTGTPSTSLGRIRIPLIANVPVSITLRVRGLAPRKVLYR